MMKPLLHLPNSLLLLSAIYAPVIYADLPLFTVHDTENYNKGIWGPLPTETFHTFNVSAYRILKTIHTSNSTPSTDLSSSLTRPENNNTYIFLTPRGNGITTNGPMILDDNGSLVWLGTGSIEGTKFAKAIGLHPQMYRGEAYLTWWMGDDWAGHGRGMHYMYDKNYQHFKTIGAIGGGTFSSDIHEFRITEDDTALLSIYDIAFRDLTSVGGPRDGAFWDCLFQEIDIETNSLLFEWRASDYIGLQDAYESYKLLNSPTGTDGWDWLHMNSIDKDPRGNYLFSARYLRALVYVDGQTGEILWQLGGKHNSFKDLSGGRIINMDGQHHARWRDNYTAITFFDNHGTNGHHNTPSRGLKIRIDEDAMTVDLIVEIKHPNGYIATSQGSVQQLDNGNLFVGYGSVAHMAEFSPDGSELLRDWQFGMLNSSDKAAKLGSAKIVNYRAFMDEWHGYPLEPPAVAIADGRFYVSWNGATEYREWIVQGTDWSTAGKEEDHTIVWEPIGSIRRNGFENDIELEREYRMYRLTALDADGKTLGVWIVRSSGLVTPIPFCATPRPNPLDWLFTAALTILFIFASTTLYRYYRLRHRISQSEPLQPQSQPDSSSLLSWRKRPWYRWWQGRRGLQLGGGGGDGPNGSTGGGIAGFGATDRDAERAEQEVGLLKGGEEEDMLDSVGDEKAGVRIVMVDEDEEGEENEEKEGRSEKLYEHEDVDVDADGESGQQGEELRRWRVGAR